MSTAVIRRSTLVDAARDALAAPSIFNTQPWIWRTVGEILQLWADRRRQLTATDGTGRQLFISCGSALHHAEVSLEAHGLEVLVHRLPDATRPDLLASLTIVGELSPFDPRRHAARTLADAIPRRRTDRRAYTAEPVPTRLISALIAAGERQGAHVHVLTRDHLTLLRNAAGKAELVQEADSDYNAELQEWTTRFGTNDGIPAAASVTTTARRVPVRHFATARGMASPGPEHDVGAEYLMIFTDADEPVDWLRAGEALSALLLTSTAAGLASSISSDVIEVAQARHQLDGVFQGGDCHPQAVVRIGCPPSGDEPGPAPRRPESEVVNP